jgi:hypothetical protein
MINCDPHYINERQSDLRAVKEGTCCLRDGFKAKRSRTSAQPPRLRRYDTAWQ